MQENDIGEFGKIILGLSEIFGGEMSPIAIDIYFNALSDFTIDEVSKGISSVVKSRVYNGMPKPAEIIEAISGSSNVQAITAWDEVLTDIRKRGRLQGGKFDNPAIEQAIRVCGGWEKICAGDEQDLQWVKKEFIEAYGAVNHTVYKTAIEAKEIIKSLTDGIG
jgi:hypothetical protein